MAEQGKDHWHSGDYQHSASFVPKLAGKVTQWLDLQKDDVVLDIGCGVLDATKMQSKPELQRATFTKVFSNAAMHWILRPAAARQPFFAAVHAALAPGGVFAFEMGGLGNVKEMAAALLVACARRAPGGLSAVVDQHYPWFFPDEAWATAALEGAGFRVDRVEREWRPTKADKGGVEGWIRLFGSMILESVPEGEQREDAVREAAEALRVVCDDGDGGEMISYVRLRALATKV
ncbi:putative methyltransferase C70.08c [Beauveria bassiana]|nr:putative methyltransferase C70.08c [Beauveria bassiana]